MVTSPFPENKTCPRRRTRTDRALTAHMSTVQSYSQRTLTSEEE